MSAPNAEVTYRGSSRVGFNAFVQVDGGPGVIPQPLLHVIRHSPTGVEWGYAGSGPADLARSMLLDALASIGEAKCPICKGSGRVVWEKVEAEAPVPFDPENELHAALLAYEEAGDDEAPMPGEGDATAAALLDVCLDCDGDGWTVVPYQAFKSEVIANLPHGGFELPRAQVLDWLKANGVIAQ